MDAHGSGKEPMYGSMGKSTKPDPNRKITYPQLLHVACLDSHNTSYFTREKTVHIIGCMLVRIKMMYA